MFASQSNFRPVRRLIVALPIGVAIAAAGCAGQGHPSVSIGPPSTSIQQPAGQPTPTDVLPMPSGASNKSAPSADPASNHAASNVTQQDIADPAPRTNDSEQSSQADSKGDGSSASSDGSSVSSDGTVTIGGPGTPGVGPVDSSPSSSEQGSGSGTAVVGGEPDGPTVTLPSETPESYGFGAGRPPLGVDPHAPVNDPDPIPTDTP